MKRKIEVFDYANDIMQALKTGVLLTTKADTVDSMAISWGSLGIFLDKDFFCTYVRESRYTKKQLDKNPEFTINVPVGAYDKKILGYCGTKSGKDTDKIKDLGLTLEEPEVISVPGIREMPLTLECRMLFGEVQNIVNIRNDALMRKFYIDVADFQFASKDYPIDYHTEFYGEIVSAYIIE
ncbi:MAG: flavin reductase [Eubacteriaceae bacterium]|nr:flavin reductase [Eubacteriaceae bacterium]